MVEASSAFGLGHDNLKATHTVLTQMATSALSPEKDALEAIVNDGYFKAEDASLGQCVQQMGDEEVAFASQQGLRFCKDKVLNHRVRTDHSRIEYKSDNCAAHTADPRIIIHVVRSGPL